MNKNNTFQHLSDRQKIMDMNQSCIDGARQTQQISLDITNSLQPTDASHTSAFKNIFLSQFCGFTQDQIKAWVQDGDGIQMTNEIFSDCREIGIVRQPDSEPTVKAIDDVFDQVKFSEDERDDQESIIERAANGDAVDTKEPRKKFKAHELYRTITKDKKKGRKIANLVFGAKDEEDPNVKDFGKKIRIEKAQKRKWSEHQNSQDNILYSPKKRKKSQSKDKDIENAEDQPELQNVTFGRQDSPVYTGGKISPTPNPFFDFKQPEIKDSNQQIVDKKKNQKIADDDILMSTRHKELVDKPWCPTNAQLNQELNDLQGPLDRRKNVLKQQYWKNPEEQDIDVVKSYSAYVDNIYGREPDQQELFTIGQVLDQEFQEPDIFASFQDVDTQVHLALFNGYIKQEKDRLLHESEACDLKFKRCHDKEYARQEKERLTHDISMRTRRLRPFIERRQQLVNYMNTDEKVTLVDLEQKQKEKEEAFERRKNLQQLRNNNVFQVRVAFHNDHENLIKRRKDGIPAGHTTEVSSTQFRPLNKNTQLK